MNEDFRDIGGHKVRVLDGGKGSTLLFFYDPWHTATGLQPFLDTAALSHRVVAVDPPGFAGSYLPEDYPLHSKDYATFLGETIEQIGGGKVTVVLSNLGLLLGLECLTQESSSTDLIQAIVITNGLIYKEQLGGLSLLRTGQFLKPSELPIDRMTFRRKLIHLYGEPGQMDEALVDLSWDYFRRGTIRSQVKLSQSIEGSVAKSQQWLRTIREDSIPTLILWGDTDPLGGKWVAERLQEDLPESEGYSLPGVGHFPHIEAPAMVTDIIDSFLQGKGDRET